MSNRKRTRSRSIQTIICSATIVRDGKEVKNPQAGRLKQIKHPPVPELSACDPWGMSNGEAWEKAMYALLADNPILPQQPLIHD